jgi:hypothetical protein
MISRIGVFGLMPGSVVKSKSSPSRRPFTLIVFPAWTVPFTDHTPLSMFFIAAITSGAEFSWLEPAGFFCGLAKAKGAFQKTSNAATSESVLAGIIFFTQWTIRLMGFFFHVI